MPYGTVKVDNVTFTNNSVDATTTFSGIYASITNNLTLSGTATAATFTGTTANFTNVNAQNIGVTTSLSGLAITGGTAGFTTITGTTVTGTTANFVTVSGTTVTGTTARFITITGGTAGFTTITGTTVTGTTANFVTVSGTTVTGTTASFTSGIFTSLSGTTHTITSGVFASGTAALPSISFVSDPNTGIYSPGADQVAVATNGTGRLFVDASGNVGVGTASPGYALDIASTDTTAGNALRLRQNATATAAGLQFTDAGVTTQHGAIVSDTSSNLKFATGNTEKLRITSAGLVGIGTSSPASTLHVAGTFRNTGQTFLGIGEATTLAYIGDPFTTNTRSIIFNRATGVTDIVNIQGLNAGVGLTDIALQAGGGRVGIGTNAPAQKLEIQDGSISIGSSVNINTANVLIAGYGYILSGTKYGNTSIRSTYENTSNTASLDFYVGTGSTGTAEKMRLDAQGRLLVGTVTGNANGGILQLTSGITFPATAVAASDVNTLDDYEEGTWTPVSASQSGTSPTYTSVGRYTKIGRQVIAYAKITYTSTAGTGGIYIDPLPFGAVDSASLCMFGNELTTLRTLAWAAGNTTTVLVTDYTGAHYQASGYIYALTFIYTVA